MTTRGPGRPLRLLEPDTRQALLDAVKLGAPVELCAAAAGIGETTWYRWMAYGRAEHEHIENGGEPHPEQAEFLAFFTDVTANRVQAATRNVAAIQKAVQGGTIIEETTKTYRDHDGQQVTEKTVKKAAPDWRAGAWYLERQFAKYFGKEAAKVEVTGAEGGPIQVAADAEDLSKRLSAHIAAGVTSLALPAASDHEHSDIIDGDVIEASLVED